MENNKSEILLYTSEDGKMHIQVHLQDETVWLTQDQMAELFDKSKSTISEHISNIYEEKELDKSTTIRKFGISELSTKPTNYYNLDVIISVGYRVSSPRGTRFRIWATQRLKEYIVKGFTMDDERLKQAGGGNYFDELLARIRDIRSSEKIFWRKVLEIYSTSIDYDPNTKVSHEFFSVVQNKMHWAAHGHTAAEVILARADADKPNMGLTSWTGIALAKADTSIAKNYLKTEELDALNRIVSMYLDFAELQALNRKPMYMKDWISKLDAFLQLSEREILTHPGSVSHKHAIEKACVEYEKYRKIHTLDITPVEKHFLEAVKEVKQLESSKKKPRKSNRK